MVCGRPVAHGEGVEAFAESAVLSFEKESLLELTSQRCRVFSDERRDHQIYCRSAQHRFVTPFAPISNKSLRTFGTLEPTITVRREVLSVIPVSGE